MLKLIHVVSRLFCAETTAPLLSTEIKSAYTFGGEKVVFDKEEVTAMKSLFPPGLSLMGFKPRSRLKDQYHIRKAYFIHPEESVIAGSTAVFQTLLHAMVELDRVAICRLASRVATEARFVALLPQLVELDVDHNQITPPGMHVIFLPFAEDMRKPPHDVGAPKATDVCFRL